MAKQLLLCTILFFFPLSAMKMISVSWDGGYSQIKCEDLSLANISPSQEQLVDKSDLLAASMKIFTKEFPKFKKIVFCYQPCDNDCYAQIIRETVSFDRPVSKEEIMLGKWHLGMQVAYLMSKRPERQIIE